jgi:hypothetical protein
MELYGGSDSNYYDQKYIDELKLKIKSYINKINDLNNLVQPEKNAAFAAKNNFDVNNLNINTTLAVENTEKMKQLNIELDRVLEELKKAKELPKLSAERARKAAEKADEIARAAEAVKKEITGGNKNESEDVLINNLKDNIENIQKKINDLNNLIKDEKNKAFNAVTAYDKNNLQVNINLAENNLKEMKKLLIDLENQQKNLKDAKKKPEGPDDGYAVTGPAAFPGSADPSNKFKEGDYVVVTGSRKKAKQKFINKTGQIKIVLEKGVGKNTSKMTRYDVDFGELGQANFKESRLKLGRKEDYKPAPFFKGGDPYYEKYLKYKAKYLELKLKI